jgi:hypothetical protein
MMDVMLHPVSRASRPRVIEANKLEVIHDGNC